MIWHPALVHFPIAFLAGAWMAETARMHPRVGLQSEGWEFLSRILLVAAIPALALAMISGSLGEDALEQVTGKPMAQAAHDWLERHELMGYLNGALATLLATWRTLRAQAMNLQEHRIFWGAFTVVMILLVAGSWMGGYLVYEFGIGVKQSP
ncbi:MAG: DUF2231 domain-containing protein [Sphingomonadales bacterium]|nr:DUF2231 domain-containing protein [Sphingomonadales bacterium]